MSYLKAEKILPKDILEMLQEYVDGAYLYIPRKEEKKKQWGERTNIKQELVKRNRDIYTKHQKGETIESLSKVFYLSEKSIQRIVLEQKRAHA